MSLKMVCPPENALQFTSTKRKDSFKGLPRWSNFLYGRRTRLEWLQVDIFQIYSQLDNKTTQLEGIYIKLWRQRVGNFNYKASKLVYDSRTTDIIQTIDIYLLQISYKWHTQRGSYNSELLTNRGSFKITFKKTNSIGKVFFSFLNAMPDWTAVTVSLQNWYITQKRT